MLLKVKVIPHARIAQLEQVAELSYRARVRAPPEKGEANRELIELIAEHFKVPKRAVRVVRGHTSREKLVELPD